MENQPHVFLGIKVKPGPIERHKLENFALDNTVDALKDEAEKKTNLPSASLELIHHGKILKDNTTLQDSGVKNGEMIHVVKKKVQAASPPPPSFTDAELQQLNASLRTLGCTPNAPGWTRAMQLLNDESAMSEIIEHAPSLNDDCVTLSILHEVELLAALGANIQTMRRGADAHPDLPNALRHLTRLVRSRSGNAASSDTVPTSGFAYSLEALSDDEDAEDEDNEEGDRNPITHEQLAAALQAATEAVSSTSGPRGGGGVSGGQDSLLRLLQAAGAGEASRNTSSATESGTPTAQGGDGGDIVDVRPAWERQSRLGAGQLAAWGGEASQNTSSTTESSTPTTQGSARSVITPEMFSEAISEAINRASARTSDTPMEQSTAASSSQSPSTREEDFATQLHHMHEMGLLDDALNVRALLICSGDVNAAINLVFSGAIGED